MTTFRLARTELRRLTSGKLPKLALVAVTLVPLLYGAMYIYANLNPYDRFSSVPAAVVVDDEGADKDDGGRLTAGEKVYDRLIESGDFDWHRVSERRATTGVSEGDYAFALMIPEGFSRALLSPGDFDPEQARLRLVTNDANNYLVGTVADRVATRVKQSVASDASSDAARELLLGLSTVHDRTAQAADGAGDLANGAGDLDSGLDDAARGAEQLSSGTHELVTSQRKLADGAAKLAEGSGQVAEGNKRLHEGLGELREKTADLPAKSEQLADGAERVAEGNAELAATAERLGGFSQHVVDKLDDANQKIAAKLRALGLDEREIERITSTLDELNQPVDDTNKRIQHEVKRVTRLSDGAERVAEGARQLADQAPEMTNGIDKLHTASGRVSKGADELDQGMEKLAANQRRAVSGTERLATGADDLADGTSRLSNGSEKLADGSTELAGKLNNGVDEIPNPDDSAREATAETIGDPVAVRDQAQTSAGSYGAGLAPYFMGLALWIGGFVLFLLMRPLSNRALAGGVAPWRIAIGGWLPAAVVGTVQAVLLYLVVTFGVGIWPAKPVTTLVFLVLTSLAFTAVVHSLNAAFGPRGKFLALVFLVLQLVSAGGTFPWQTTPEALHPLHHVLPLSYVVDGLRQLLYGGQLDNAAHAALVMGSYLLGGLLLSTAAAARQRVWTAKRLRPELSL
ncbi:putative membrane protein [Actinopolyspora xinjiangensis]|uniref:Putative membrane protein n=1 Tax=Actinopolyspora xinjiangensis TaxID=405564 RepID=A0A1H0WVU1_9ACTN|nr:YhgE/Pip domain-containing protein [Actinopolyspora xinjiangensis]SDP94848.1 putative membrane protein [Actinopolyspora xinjiangensis]